MKASSSFPQVTGLDTELHEIRRELDRLRTAANKQPDNPPTPTQQQVISGGLVVQRVSGNPTYTTPGIEFEENVGLELDGSNGFVYIRLPSPELSGYIKDPTIAFGDTLFRNAVGKIDRLAIGSDGTLFGSVSSIPAIVIPQFSGVLRASDGQCTRTGGAVSYNINGLNGNLQGTITKLPNVTDSSIWWEIPNPRYWFAFVGFRIHAVTLTAALAQDLTKPFALNLGISSYPNGGDMTAGSVSSNAFTFGRAATGLQTDVDVAPANLGSFAGGEFSFLRLRRDGTDTAAADLGILGVEMLYRSYI